MPGKHVLPRLVLTRPHSVTTAASEPGTIGGPGVGPGLGSTGDDDVLLTPAEAAERLAVTERVLERWRGTGDGPRFARLSRKTVRYRLADIRAFVSGSVRANTAA